TATTVNGIATFSNLSYNAAETMTINFTATGLTNIVSSNVVVGPTTANQLVFTAQPGSTSDTGSPLTPQPVLKSKDTYGNLSAVGLPTSLNVALSLTSGSGSLTGTATLDIGT